MVTLSTGWNIIDEEQRKDLEFVLSAPNRAGRIRECVRRVRLMMQGAVAQAPMIAPAPIIDNVPVSDNDILDGLI